MHERERWQMILGAIKDRAVVTVRELIERTGASPATLRRDLAKLEETGQIKRVHGGVEALNFDDRPHLATRAFEASQNGLRPKCPVSQTEKMVACCSIEMSRDLTRQRVWARHATSILQRKVARLRGPRLPPRAIRSH